MRNVSALGAGGVRDQSRMAAIRHEARGAAREPDGGTPGRHSLIPCNSKKLLYAARRSRYWDLPEVKELRQQPEETHVGIAGDLGLDPGFTHRTDQVDYRVCRAPLFALIESDSERPRDEHGELSQRCIVHPFCLGFRLPSCRQFKVPHSDKTAKRQMSRLAVFRIRRLILTLADCSQVRIRGRDRFLSPRGGQAT